MLNYMVNNNKIATTYKRELGPGSRYLCVEVLRIVGSPLLPIPLLDSPTSLFEVLNSL